MPNVKLALAGRWVDPLNVACRKYEITSSVRRLAAFLGHIAHESGSLRHVEENLNYKDPKRINELFSAINTDKEAEAYVKKPEALANKIYADKLGNGNTASGDGWKYRGRGLIQLTGKSNYAAFSKDAGVDCVADPDLVATPKYAAMSAGWFWKAHGLNELADDEKYKALSKRINKSLSSFPEREKNRKRALEALCLVVMVNRAISFMNGGMVGWF